MRRGWFCALLAFLGFVNGLVPWTLRNLRQFDDVIPVVDSVYPHLWVGNQPGQTGGTGLEGTSYPAKSSYRVSVPSDASEIMAKDNQVDRYYQFAGKYWQSVGNDPAGTLQRRLLAGVAFVFGDAWFEPEHRLWRGDGEYGGILYGSLLTMVLLAMIGWRWSYGWRHSSMLLSLAVIWIPLPYLLSHAEHFSGPRLPLDGALLCYAAVAVAGIIPWTQLGGGRALREGSPANSD
jgi:hypothetical protein